MRLSTASLNTCANLIKFVLYFCSALFSILHVLPHDHSLDSHSERVLGRKAAAPRSGGEGRRKLVWINISWVESHIIRAKGEAVGGRRTEDRGQGIRYPTSFCLYRCSSSCASSESLIGNLPVICPLDGNGKEGRKRLPTDCNNKLTLGSEGRRRSWRPEWD